MSRARKTPWTRHRSSTGHTPLVPRVGFAKFPNSDNQQNFDGKYVSKFANPRPPMKRDHLGWTELSKELAAAMSWVCCSDTTGDLNKAVSQQCGASALLHVVTGNMSHS